LCKFDGRIDRQEGTLQDNTHNISVVLKYKSKRIDITPVIPARLTGMSNQDKSQGIHNHLEINAMVLNQNEKFIYIVSIDTLFVNKDLKNSIINEIHKYDELIPETDILILSTHTHYAPSLEEKRTDFGERDDAYVTYLRDKISDLFKLLDLEHFTEIEMEVSKGKTDHLTTNRRRKVRRPRAYFSPIISMEPNLKGFKNEEFKIIKVSEANSSGHILGVIWSFPCHPTNLFDKSLISAEYPGEVRKAIRQKQDSNDLAVIYMPGFAGDVRAYPPKRASIFKTLRDLFQLSYPVSYYRFMNTQEYNT